MFKTKTRASKLVACANCGGNDLQKRIATYPVRVTEPGSLAGKEIHVGQVALYECSSCGHLIPTPAGQAKVHRCVAQAIRSCDRPGCYEVFPRTSPRQRFCSEGAAARWSAFCSGNDDGESRGRDHGGR
jgi:hypothetical protein